MSAPAQGAMERVPPCPSWPMTSSMMTLVMSGTRAMTAMPPSEEPSASTTSFGYRHAYPVSLLAQPGSFAPAPPRCSVTCCLPST